MGHGSTQHSYILATAASLNKFIGRTAVKYINSLGPIIQPLLCFIGAGYYRNIKGCIVN